MKVRLAITALAMSVGLVSSASAIDFNRQMASACSFADNPLASHTKVHHGFKNTSGAQQWLTCPAVRGNTGNISLSFIEYFGSGTLTRLEMRSENAGAVVGWDRDREVIIGSSNNRRAEWFVTGSGNAPSSVAVAFEMRLEPTQSVFMYSLGEI